VRVCVRVCVCVCATAWRESVCVCARGRVEQDGGGGGLAGLISVRQRAAYPDPTPVIPLPESLAAQGPCVRLPCPGLARSRNVSRHSTVTARRRSRPVDCDSLAKSRFSFAAAPRHSSSTMALKSKVGLAAAKTAAMRINLNIDGCGSRSAPVPCSCLVRECTRTLWLLMFRVVQTTVNSSH